MHFHCNWNRSSTASPSGWPRITTADTGSSGRCPMAASTWHRPAIGSTTSSATIVSKVTCRPTLWGLRPVCTPTATCLSPTATSPGSMHVTITGCGSTWWTTRRSGRSWGRPTEVTTHPPPRVQLIGPGERGSGNVSFQATRNYRNFLYKISLKDGSRPYCDIQVSSLHVAFVLYPVILCDYETILASQHNFFTSLYVTIRRDSIVNY